jgi:hypothetical protein
MTLATKVVLNQLVGMVAGIAGIEDAHKGIRESQGPQVSISVSVGGQTLSDKATQLFQREAGYFVEFAYAVEGAEDTAEDVLADALDSFIALWLADRTLGGKCDTSRLDFSLTTDPLYRPTAGQEFRVFPLLVWATQRTTF